MVVRLDCTAGFWVVTRTKSDGNVRLCFSEAGHTHQYQVELDAVQARALAAEIVLVTPEA